MQKRARILDVYAALDGAVTAHYEVTTHPEIFDGVRLRPGQSVAVISHNARVILSCERVESNAAFLVNPQSTDSACYSYGTSHSIMEGRYRQGELGPDSLRVEGRNPVSGSPILVDVFDCS